MAVDKGLLDVLQDYHNMKMKEKQTVIDALVAENDRLTQHVERLALDLAMKESDFKGVIK